MLFVRNILLLISALNYFLAVPQLLQMRMAFWLVKMLVFVIELHLPAFFVCYAKPSEKRAETDDKEKNTNQTLVGTEISPFWTP